MIFHRNEGTTRRKNRAKNVRGVMVVWPHLQSVKDLGDGMWRTRQNWLDVVHRVLKQSSGYQVHSVSHSNLHLLVQLGRLLHIDLPSLRFIVLARLSIHKAFTL